MRNNLVWDSYWGSADISVIRDFERKVGRRFPAEYVEIVARYNGAFVEGCDAYRFHCNATGRVEIYGLGILHAFGSTDSVTETMRWSYDHKPFGFPDSLISFARDGGGNRLCFDYSESPDSDEPTVVLWNINVQPGSGKEKSWVAASFSGLLDMLFEEE